MPTSTAHSAAQAELFDAAPEPRSLAYRPDLLPAGEAETLAGRLADLPFKPFEFHGYLGARRVCAFGWRYDYGQRRIEAAAPMPDLLVSLRERVAAFAGVAPEAFVQAMATEYAPGAGIGWHRDKPQFGLVAGVSLASPCVMRFRKAAPGGGWIRAAQPLEPGSAYLLSGPAREAWEHSIAPQTALRYSVTFRTLVNQGRQGGLSAARRFTSK